MIQRVLFCVFLTTLLVACSTNSDNSYATLKGVVTNFDNVPIKGAAIKLKDKNFNDLYETVSDENGKYSVKVKQGTYYSIFVIRENDYAKTSLEYWAWNAPVVKDMVINPRYDDLEVYGINVFEPKVSPYDTYRVYFRPMSLKMYSDAKDIKKGDTINISPDLTKDDITVKINGVTAGIKTLDRVLEYNSGGNYIFAYEMQVLKPEGTALSKEESVPGYDKITVLISSSETGEKGEADYFYKLND